MDFIEEVLSKSYKSNKVKWFASIIAIIFFYIYGGINFILFHNLDQYVMVSTMLMGTIIACILGYTLGQRLGKKLFKKKENKF